MKTERKKERFCVWKPFSTKLYSILNFFQFYLFSNQLNVILLLISMTSPFRITWRFFGSEMQRAAGSSDRKLWQQAVKAPVRHSDSSLQVCFWQRSERFSWLDGWSRECAWNEWVQYSSVFTELVNARLYNKLQYFPILDGFCPIGSWFRSWQCPAKAKNSYYTLTQNPSFTQRYLLIWDLSTFF